MTARPRRVARLRAVLVALLTAGALGGAADQAVAGYDQFQCAASNSYWCTSPYEHHSKVTEAWYDGSGNLPLAVGSVATSGNYWIFYADTSTRVYNYVYACYTVSCANGNNSPILGRMYWQNRHASTHTVHARDTF